MKEGLFSQGMLASATQEALITHPTGQLALLLGCLSVVFWAQGRPIIGRVFKILPAILFCYFVPTALTAFRVLPEESALYRWVKDFVLPASLILLTISLDVPAILRLGPRALVVFVAGAVGVVVGGPLSLAIWQHKLPDDAWKALTYLAGTWIGGSANGVAVQESYGVASAVISPLIVVDIAVANVWMAFLIYLAGRRERVDCWLKADSSMIAVLQHEMQEYQDSVTRPTSTKDLLFVVTLGFGSAWMCHVAAEWLMTLPAISAMKAYLGSFAWKVILVTTLGVGLSFTRVRSLEGAGASKMGTVLLYMLVACIGAEASFRRMADSGWYLAVGATWMLIHGVIIFGVGRLVRAPIFFIAVGSQANIGGAASAPIVASAFNPVLASVGVLLAILGYVLGTYGGIICVQLCRMISD